MSGTSTTDRPRMRQSEGAGGEDDTPEDRARRMGWKPQEEYKGDPAKWKPAEEFLKDGFDNPAVLHDRYKVLDGRTARMERELRETRDQLAGASSTMIEMSNMMRSSEQRAYDRAKRDLEAERLRAVETGDTDKFQALEREIAALPAPPAAPAGGGANAGAEGQGAGAGGTGKAPPAGQGGQQQAGDRYSSADWAQATQPWFDENPWYVVAGKKVEKDHDAELSREADTIHIGLRNTRPDLSPEQNLVEVNKRLRRMFPEKFDQRRNADEDPPEDNPRRREPSGYLPPSSESPPRSRNARDFASMPKDSRDSYTRYAKMLEGKGKPLSKEEWAQNYWAQSE